MVVEKKNSTAGPKETVQSKATDDATTNGTQEEVTCTSEECKRAQASRIIRNHMLTTMGIGLVPFPIIDMIAITGVQLNMLHKLSNTYDIPFTEHKIKNILAALIGGSSVIPIGRTLISFVKVVPVIGPALGAITVPATAGAITYAVGKVFHQHFASGGTFLTFDPDKVKEYYATMLEEGESVAGNA